METWQGKHFSVTDPKGVKTVIYEVYVTKKEYLDQYPKYTMERLTIHVVMFFLPLTHLNCGMSSLVYVNHQ